MTLPNKNYRYICLSDSTNSHGVYYMGLNLQVMMNLMNSLHSYRCVFLFFTGLILVYGTTGKVFCLNTSGCYILILYWFVFLLYCCCLMTCFAWVEWAGLLWLWCDGLQACCFCFSALLLLLCLFSFYYLPRVKPGNYSVCLCRSVWDMASFLSYTLGQSSQVKLTCLFYLIDWLIDWLANGLLACGQRGKTASWLIGWLVDWWCWCWFDFDGGVDVDTKYLLSLTYFLGLYLD